MFKKAKKNKKGFTLAELLIVVAIIAVLVAISIPIFSNQLEKAREATDEANIRAMYAECAAAALTENITSDTDTNANPKVTKSADGVITATGTVKMTQQKKGFAAGESASVNIGGITISSDKFDVGTATITVKSDGTTPTISISASK